MRNVLLAMTLALVAAPAFAGSASFDLPRLTWPADDAITGSTKGCDQSQATTPVCQ